MRESRIQIINVRRTPVHEDRVVLARDGEIRRRRERDIQSAPSGDRGHAGRRLNAVSDDNAEITPENRLHESAATAD